IPAAGLFSTKKFMSHHGHVENEAVADAPQTQALRGNAQDKLRCFTQMSRVVLQPLKAYLLERVSQYMDDCRAARKSGVSQSHVLDVREANGPEQPEDVDEDAGLFDSQEPLVPLPADTLVMQQYGSGLAQDHLGSRNEPVTCRRASVISWLNLARASQLGTQRWQCAARAGRKGKKAPGDAETPPDPSQLDPALRSLPAWAPQIAPGWRDLTSSLSALARHLNSAILYALPPLHIFYTTPRTMAGDSCEQATPSDADRPSAQGDDPDSLHSDDSQTASTLIGGHVGTLLFHFRLQLLALDRELAAHSYLSSTAVHARPRERVVMDVWGGYRVRPMWEKR
ncbi:hypothetical protein B0H21DRAFT_713359, partial [Amylocystis lapponica]